MLRSLLLLGPSGVCLIRSPTWLPVSGNICLKVVRCIITYCGRPQSSVPRQQSTHHDLTYEKDVPLWKTSSQPITQLLFWYGPLAAWPKSARLPPNVVEAVVVVVQLSSTAGTSSSTKLVFTVLFLRLLGSRSGRSWGLSDCLSLFIF